jgi:hypothetical protein
MVVVVGTATTCEDVFGPMKEAMKDTKDTVGSRSAMGVNFVKNLKNSKKKCNGRV